MASEFKLPELGENVNSGTVAKVLVSKGDSIDKEQNVIELETDKAVVEVPSDISGVVKDIFVKEGDEIKVGQKVFSVEGGKEGQGGEEPSREPSEKKEEEGGGDGKGRKEEPAEQAEKKESPQKEAKPSPSAKKEESPGGGVVEIKLPELGENVETGTVAKVLVNSGEEIQKDQNILELETDKAVLEVPAEVGGTVKEVFVKEGEQVKVGQKILTISSAEKAAEERKEEKPERPAAEKETEQVAETEANEEEEERGEKKAESPVEAYQAPAVRKERREPQEIAPAAPSVRRFAREIGIDINQVPGSGPSGRISVDDVKNFAKMINKQKAASRTVLRGIEPEPLPDFSKWGEVEHKPMSNVRQRTAKHLGYAWATVAHVTQFDKADITELEKFRKQYGKKAEAAGGKLTATAILLKIAASALKVFPQFNASINMAQNEVIYKKYYNVGVAVDTDRGLLVPVIRDVDKKNIIRLSVELTELAQKARDRKLSLEEMQGGNFSISNLGGIGGTAFTPIVNSPEVAILGVSRSRIEPVYINGQFEPRSLLPLSLSYDHRLIDGADAARFLRWVAEAIEQPFLIVLEG
ncbi:MAG: dihydrolipoyllysine-residue acetyltransferase [Calditrichia bacterium]